MKAVGIGAVQKTKQDDAPKVNDPRLLPDKFLQRTAKVTPWGVASMCVCSQSLKETSIGLPVASIC